MSGNFASDYVDVAERIGIFREKYPDGSLQPADPAQPFTMVEVDGARFIIVVAAAYRSPDDPRPGIGMAQEQIPGRTPYTRGSELQNAETSAWGRAIVAALAADTKKGIASADEVRNRRAEQEADPIAVRDPGRTRGKTTRTKPDGPQEDVWTTALPPFDTEAFRTKLAACGTPAEVRELDKEAHVAFGEGRLTAEDAKALKVEIDQRLAELTGADAA